MVSVVIGSTFEVVVEKVGELCTADCEVVKCPGRDVEENPQSGERYGNVHQASTECKRS